MWGLLVGAMQAASPVASCGSSPQFSTRCDIVFIAAIYIGFAVGDGRPKVIAVESTVAAAFLVLASVGVTGSAWLLVRRLRSPWHQGLLATPNRLRAGTRWWPPFCATVDFLVATILAVEIAYGMSFH